MPLSKPVDFSSAGAQNARDGCEKSVHLVGNILARRDHHCMASALALLSTPLEEEHSKAVVNMKTTNGARWLHIELGSLQRAKCIKDLVGTLMSRDL